MLSWFEKVGMLAGRFARSIKQLHTKPCFGRLLIENKCAYVRRQYKLNREVRMWEKERNPTAMNVNSVNKWNSGQTQTIAGRVNTEEWQSDDNTRPR